MANGGFVTFNNYTYFELISEKRFYLLTKILLPVVYLIFRTPLLLKYMIG